MRLSARMARLHKRGGKHHDVPASRKIEETIDEYLSKVSLDGNRPLFQIVKRFLKRVKFTQTKGLKSSLQQRHHGRDING